MTDDDTVLLLGTQRSVRISKSVNAFGYFIRPS